MQRWVIEFMISLHLADPLVSFPAFLDANLQRQFDPSQLHPVYKNMACATWLASGDGYCWDIPDWCELTGLTPEQAEGDGWADALHPDDKAATLAEWADALAHPRPYSVIYRARFANGEFHWINARALPVFRSNGDVQNWVGLCFDLGPVAQTGDPHSIAKIEEIESRHLRAARAMIGISAGELATASQISSSTIRRMEAEDAPVKTRRSIMERLIALYRSRGVVFYSRDGKVSVGDLAAASGWLPEWTAAASASK